MAVDTYAGPVSFLVFGFPASTSVGAGLESVLEHVENGNIDILDLEFVTRGSAGEPVVLTLAEVQEHSNVDLSVFEGAFSGILEADDLISIVADLKDGQFAIALVYEDRTLAQAAAKWTSVGGFEVFSGGVDIEELSTTLEQE